MFLTIILTLVLTGALGGLTGHLLYGGSWSVDALKNILFGMCAALMVPLFLNTISSTLLLELLKGSELDHLKYLILIGFCLIASISSQKFIRLMSANVIKELEQVKETAEDAQAKATSALDATAGTVEPDTTKLSDNEQKSITDLSADTKNVLIHLMDGPYTMRSATGLAEELKINTDIITDALASLEALKFVASGVNSKQQKRWYLTGVGKVAALKLKNQL